MNLISGNMMNYQESQARLEKIERLILHTYNGPALTPDCVIHACDAFSKKLNEAEHLHLLIDLGMPEYKAREELSRVRFALSGEYLKKRVEAELGKLRTNCFQPAGSSRCIRQEIKPLGVLLHIAAGNVDALPVFSVIEGLLTGNINILKLPGTDDGLSITVLKELMEIEPLIADYVYVFDYPSEDIVSIEKMAAVSDAIVVWGGDAAVAAVRRMAKPNTRIIEWGHKISFAYVSGNDIPDEELEGIAYNICDTNQTLCSSCQGIYVNSESYLDAVAFAGRFLKLLDQQAVSMPRIGDPFLDAQKTLEIYTEELEAAASEKQVFKTDRCSIIAYRDSLLTTSYMYRNCWVKPLPKKHLLSELMKYKNHLQTVALICEESERNELETILLRTGIVRITNGRNMSQSYCGMPHDGEYSLRRYVKIVSCEY